MMARRPVHQTVKDGWLALADIFDHLLGGSAATTQAAAYLRGLARDNLPLHPLPDLPWHREEAVIEAIVANPEPHPVVLGVLCPSAPLRAVWRRNLRH